MIINDLNKAMEKLAESDDIVPFLNTLKKYIDEKKKFSVITKKTGMSKEQLNDILDNKTDLYFDDCVAILVALGLRITLKDLS